ncbi:major facilitator superfamily domain-containing protein, partial [Amylostereum chailletii]
MSVAQVLPTVVNFACTAPRSLLYGFRTPSRVSTNAPQTPVQHEEVDPAEFRLPKTSSLVVTILMNILAQISFFIIVSSGSKYAEFLGGSETFSGLVIGIPTVISGLALIPLVRIDHGRYKGPLIFASVTAMLGNVLYGLAYHARFLYLILIARMVMGLSFTSYLYTKRYFSDSRVVGMRRRTTLAGWLVVGQGAGFTVGPFLGGLLYKIGFENEIFNGYTSPGWLMAAVWLAFTAVMAVWFEDVPRGNLPSPATEEPIPLQTLTPSTRRMSKEEIVEVRKSFEEQSGRPDLTSPTPEDNPPMPELTYRPTPQQWAVIGTMCWWAMTCFFVLGAWEANIPIQTAHAFGASPF